MTIQNASLGLCTLSFAVWDGRIMVFVHPKHYRTDNANRTVLCIQTSIGVSSCICVLSYLDAMLAASWRLAIDQKHRLSESLPTVAKCAVHGLYFSLHGINRTRIYPNYGKSVFLPYFSYKTDICNPVLMATFLVIPVDHSFRGAAPYPYLWKHWHRICRRRCVESPNYYILPNLTSGSIGIGSAEGDV